MQTLEDDAPTGQAKHSVATRQGPRPAPGSSAVAINREITSMDDRDAGTDSGGDAEGTDRVDICLVSFGPSKIKVIKIVRQLLKLGLSEAKDLVESAPVIVIRNVPPERAMQIRTALETAGATVSTEPSGASPSSPTCSAAIGKRVKETKCTCSACGNIWYYGMTDVVQNLSDASSDCGKSMMCCTGCLPAVFIPDRKPVDLNKCPKCGSRAIKREEVIHEVS